MTTCTSPPRRSSAASWSTATASPVRAARRTAPSASRRWSGSTPSTAVRPRSSPTVAASMTWPPSSRASASSSGPDDATLKAVEFLTPFGRGSRVTITGGAWAGKSHLLRQLAAIAGRIRGRDRVRRARRRAPGGAAGVERGRRSRPAPRSASRPPPRLRTTPSSSSSTRPAGSPRAAPTRSS